MLERSMSNFSLSCLILAYALLSLPGNAPAANVLKHYYAHDAAEDSHGVIAPWYSGQNGLVDLRVRVAAEFLKRYPWVETSESVMAGPHWVFNARVDLGKDGTIHVLPATDSMNGNLGQRFKYITEAMPRYYRYIGDPAVFSYVKIASDFLLDYYMTPANHPWPKFPISVPVKGKPYGPANPGGWIQLDLSAGIGLGLIRAYQMTGETRYFEAAKHIGDVFASKCNLQRGARPWNRYAETGEARWCEKPTGNILTGGVANILIFLEELMRLGYEGNGAAIVRARDAGQAYLRDTLLPAWTITDTWGRHYWDWEHTVQGILPTGWVAQYILDHKDVFPNWKNDVRNILSLYLNHACVSPKSNGDVYSGAWAYPEGAGCCGFSLDICPVFLGRFWGRYGVEAQSEWAREITRRKTILGFYHFHEEGMVEDNIYGGQITAREWSELIGFGPILLGLEIMGWLPEMMAPARENHLVRSSAIVNRIVYNKGRIEYTTFDAPVNTVDVLRLAFAPRSVIADGKPLRSRSNLAANGYSVRKLTGGDCIVSIRRDGAKSVVLTGDDPQQLIDDGRLQYNGTWQVSSNQKDSGGGVHLSGEKNAAVTCHFEGNQVRLMGRADSSGGLADIYLDNTKQKVGIDCWIPSAVKHQQVLYSRSGLSNGPHELKIVVRGEKNSYANGANIYVDGIQFSAASTGSDFGSGGGPVGPQRMIFGFTDRKPYVDSSKQEWLPGTEFVVRTGDMTDSVAAWWTQPVKDSILGTPDPALYSYGVHAPEFWVNLTVGPGTYNVRLKFAERRDPDDPKRRPMKVAINGQPVAQALDVAQKAGGYAKPLDLSFERIRPEHGIIEIRFTGTEGGEAMIQGIELTPVQVGK